LREIIALHDSPWPIFIQKTVAATFFIGEFHGRIGVRHASQSSARLEAPLDRYRRGSDFFAAVASTQSRITLSKVTSWIAVIAVCRIGIGRVRALDFLGLTAFRAAPDIGDG
jgi:hypothetical protein